MTGSWMNNSGLVRKNSWYGGSGVRDITYTSAQNRSYAVPDDKSAVSKVDTLESITMTASRTVDGVYFETGVVVWNFTSSVSDILNNSVLGKRVFNLYGDGGYSCQGQRGTPAVEYTFYTANQGGVEYKNNLRTVSLYFSCGITDINTPYPDLETEPIFRDMLILDDYVESNSITSYHAISNIFKPETASALISAIGADASANIIQPLFTWSVDSDNVLYSTNMPLDTYYNDKIYGKYVAGLPNYFFGYALHPFAYVSEYFSIDLLMCRPCIYCYPFLGDKILLPSINLSQISKIGMSYTTPGGVVLKDRAFIPNCEQFYTGEAVSKAPSGLFYVQSNGELKYYNEYQSGLKYFTNSRCLWYEY